MQRPTPRLYVRHDVPLRLWPRKPTPGPARVQAKDNVLIWVYKKTRDILESTVSTAVKKGRLEMLMSLRNVPQIFYTSFSFEDLLSHSS